MLSFFISTSAARGGGLSYDLEFLVFGIYTAYSEEPEPGQQRALFHYNEGENRSNVFRFLPVKNKRKYTAEDATQVIINPCQKPIRLMRHIIEHFTLANDNVLDLCSGTGSTAIACLLSNRNCVSVEKQEFQGTMIQSRINTFITTYENEDLSEAGGRWDIMEKEF
jgi:DNA modification methylase